MRPARFALAASLLAAALSPTLALAQTDYAKPIQHVGVQGNMGYIIFTTPPSAGCLNNDVYFDVTSDAGKGYFATAMSAYMAGKPVSRIDYTKGSDGICTPSLIEL